MSEREKTSTASKNDDDATKEINQSRTTTTATTTTTSNKNIDILIFDLDGTLYDESCGYTDEIHNNIYQFMVEQNGCDQFKKIKTLEDAKQVFNYIFQKYNLTKRGLIGEGYQFDSAYYDTYVRKNASRYFTNDPELRKFLCSIPTHKKKVIFTNAPKSSAIEILTLLGVIDLFDLKHIYGTEFMNHGAVCKPERKAFELVLDDLGILNSKDEYSKICYFEDSYRNLHAGKQLGFQTVFIKSNTMNYEGTNNATIDKNKEQQEQKVTNSNQKDLLLSEFDAVVENKVDEKILREKMPAIWL